MTDNPHLHSTLAQCRLINLETHSADGGKLTVADNSHGLPFVIRRVFYTYDIPAGAIRGGHSHREEEEMIVAVTGCFDVTVTDGLEWRTFTLRRADQGLYVPAGLWVSLAGFSAGCVVLSMSSTLYVEENYVRDYDEFLRLRGL